MGRFGESQETAWFVRDLSYFRRLSSAAIAVERIQMIVSAHVSDCGETKIALDTLLDAKRGKSEERNSLGGSN